MGYIFNIPLANIDEENPQRAIRQMWKYLKAMEAQLEFKLVNLDSTNVKEISTDETKITSGSSVVLNGEYLDLKKNKYRFTAGTDDSGRFVFELTNGSGEKVFYLSGNDFVLSRSANITIDGGTW